MSSAVYQEPYKLPAGIMALAVHAAFFSLLYFGFTWQALPPETMSVQLWKSLPNEVQAPPEKVKVEPAVKPAEPEKMVKPDIALPDKKKVEVKPVIPKPVEVKKPEAKPVEQKTTVDNAAVREKAAQEAAVGKVVDEFVGKIQNKIRPNIHAPLDVADDARVEFLVKLLPGGTVLNVIRLKSSGNAAYDSAVERAILKSQPLPLPLDATMFNRFRELKLGFQPKKTE